MTEVQYKINGKTIWKNSIILKQILINFENNYHYSINPLKNRILCLELKTLQINVFFTVLLRPKNTRFQKLKPIFPKLKSGDNERNVFASMLELSKKVTFKMLVLVCKFQNQR